MRAPPDDATAGRGGGEEGVRQQGRVTGGEKIFTFHQENISQSENISDPLQYWLVQQGNLTKRNISNIFMVRQTFLILSCKNISQNIEIFLV